MKIQPNWKILILNLLYIFMVLLFLHSQFQSSQQSAQISTLMLTNNDQQKINSSSTVNAYGQKVLFILIDSSNFQYYKQIPIIAKLLSKKPKNCLLKKVKIRQPTMTTQKIQTLMTGSQIFSSTSIIDAFFSSSVQVDNIVNQVNIHHGKTVFLGDDTWGKLFNFAVQYPCIKTFDIWDWDSCDSIIYQNLLDEIKKQGQKAEGIDIRQLIVAHFLALDHIGHSTSSLTHDKFAEKKQQISNFLEKLVLQMDQNYFLIITGDHGMRDDGNHGGASKLQTQTFFFVYSKGGEIIQLSQIGTIIGQIRRQVIQPDITTTLSLLLSIPIVTNSIGIPIFLLPKHMLKKQQITSSVYKHFSNLIKYYKIECEDLQSSLSGLISIQQNCLYNLSRNSPNKLLLHSTIAVMIVICLWIVYLLKVSTYQFILGISVAVPHSFSWYLIRNSSTYYLIVCVVICLWLIGDKKWPIIKIAIAMMFLSQIQGQKDGQYVGNMVRLQIIWQILGSRLVLISVSLAWVYYEIVRIYNKNKRKQKYQLLILYGSLLLVASSYLCKLLQLHTLCYLSNIILTIATSILIIFSSLFRIVEYYLIIFLGDNAIVIYIVTKFVFHIQAQISHNAPKPFVYYGLAHYTWWVMGNRYEYSSINIRQSYIFTSNYDSIINPLCLCLYMIVPYLLAICLFHQFHYYQQSHQFIALANQVQTQRKQPILIYKFTLIPQAWLIFCFINLVFNNQKILYTIVYVPMTIIQSTKLLILLILIMIYCTGLTNKQ